MFGCYGDTVVFVRLWRETKGYAFTDRIGRSIKPILLYIGQLRHLLTYLLDLYQDTASIDSPLDVIRGLHSPPLPWVLASVACHGDSRLEAPGHMPERDVNRVDLVP